MHNTVAFSKRAANVFFHILTQCNLACRHCYINPEQHGSQRLSLQQIKSWLGILARRSPNANLIFLGGEPTLHPDLADAVKAARGLGYGSVTIDTNGYLFHNILDRITARDVDFISFSLDGSTAAANDAIRGQGSFETCTTGITRARDKGFQTSLIYTVSSFNIDDLKNMPPLLADLQIDHFFIQIIGLRGQSAENGNDENHGMQVSREQWLRQIPPIAEKVTRSGITVTYPKVFLNIDEHFECAGRVADNYFIFPNGRVYRCPLCEDYPLHSLVFEKGTLVPASRINEEDLFSLDIAEGCVMNKLVQPKNIAYLDDGRPAYKIACCLLKERITPG